MTAPSADVICARCGAIVGDVTIMAGRARWRAGCDVDLLVGQAQPVADIPPCPSHGELQIRAGTLARVRRGATKVRGYPLSR